MPLPLKSLRASMKAKGVPMAKDMSAAMPEQSMLRVMAARTSGSIMVLSSSLTLEPKDQLA